MWDHRLIDNFWSDDIYAELSALRTKNVDPNEVARYNHIIKDGLVVKADLISEDLVWKIHRLYHPRMMQWLEELAPEKVSQVESSDICVTVFGTKMSKRIHCDKPFKLLTTIVYMAPENDNATVLYDTEDGGNPYTIEWKQNRALVYANIKDSWHGYTCAGQRPRYTILYALRGKGRQVQ